MPVHLHIIHAFGYGGDTVSRATHNRPVIDCPGRATEKMHKKKPGITPPGIRVRI